MEAVPVWSRYLKKWDKSFLSMMFFVCLDSRIKAFSVLLPFAGRGYELRTLVRRAGGPLHCEILHIRPRRIFLERMLWVETPREEV
jgi:hypothetical protein